jgi:hypothetical protein
MVLLGFLRYFLRFLNLDFYAIPAIELREFASYLPPFTRKSLPFCTLPPFGLPILTGASTT